MTRTGRIGRRRAAKSSGTAGLPYKQCEFQASCFPFPPTNMPETALIVPHKMSPSSFASMSGRAGFSLPSRGSSSAPKISSGWEGPEPRARVRTYEFSRLHAPPYRIPVISTAEHTDLLDSHSQLRMTPCDLLPRVRDTVVLTTSPEIEFLTHQ